MLRGAENSPSGVAYDIYDVAWTVASETSVAPRDDQVARRGRAHRQDKKLLYYRVNQNSNHDDSIGLFVKMCK